MLENVPEVAYKRCGSRFIRHGCLVLHLTTSGPFIAWLLLFSVWLGIHYGLIYSNPISWPPPWLQPEASEGILRARGKSLDISSPQTLSQVSSLEASSSFHRRLLGFSSHQVIQAQGFRNRTSSPLSLQTAQQLSVRLPYYNSWFLSYFASCH